MAQTLSQHRIFVDLWLTPEQYQHYYAGDVYYVQATAIDGRQIRFPANILRQVVSHDGVRGRFVIEFDWSGKFQRICRIR